MHHSRDHPDPIAQWLALLDAAQIHLDTFSPHERTALDEVGHMLDALLDYEHTLTDLQRYEARLTLWKRDHPDQPLPEIDWSVCQCRICQRERRLQRLHPVAWQVQAQVLARQRQRQLKGTIFR